MKEGWTCSIADKLFYNPRRFAEGLLTAVGSDLPSLLGKKGLKPLPKS